ncbi:MAG: HmuY family protein [Muribaculaceae bacterium]|nr:HmuY family protein [Muribaculaceae bacterium]
MLKRYLLPGASAVLLSACNGIFGDIYDDPAGEPDTGYGFVIESENSMPGTIYIDATDYRDWVYLNFGAASAVTLDVDAPAPERWDMAVHRYDVKTNGGAVLQTEVSDFGEVALLPGAAFTPDVWTTGTIVTDMSGMMDGNLEYAGSFYNPVLSQWLDVDKSTMPPVYTLSGRVYVLRLSSGDYAAVKLVNYMDASAVKGFMTIQYVYPYLP